ncbi:uncharacterized protein LOC142977381 [Anticarsia gemmatalis]|uniref:uncharacterized protein LOC142977381 n=1 Tax=Anticarsia gemmatalis TaxID=129554 RepID=UPI003F75A128
MFKPSFVFLNLIVVGLSVWSVNCLSEEEEAAIIEALKPIVMDCIEECGLTEEDLKKENHKDMDINFKKCFLKKIGLLNEKGEYDREAVKQQVILYTDNEDEANKLQGALDECFKGKEEELKDDKDAENKRVDIIYECLKNFKEVRSGTTCSFVNMSKFTCLVVCFVAAALNGVYAVSEEEKSHFRESVMPLVLQCSQEHGVSLADIKAAKTSRNIDGVKPCFLGCVFKKAGVITEQGVFDVDTGLTKLRKYVNTDEDFDKFADVGKKCASVNDKPVSDGEAGCERAKMLMSCFLEHKAEVLIADDKNSPVSGGCRVLQIIQSLRRH